MTQPQERLRPRSWQESDLDSRHDQYDHTGMSNTVSAVEARKNLGRFLNMVVLNGDEVVIERDGKPVAKLGPVTVSDRRGSGRLDLRRIRGVGRDTWAGVDPDGYVRKERESWA